MTLSGPSSGSKTTCDNLEEDDNGSLGTRFDFGRLSLIRVTAPLYYKESRSQFPVRVSPESRVSSLESGVSSLESRVGQFGSLEYRIRRAVPCTVSFQGRDRMAMERRSFGRRLCRLVSR
jgi:hypothetical protein